MAHSRDRTSHDKGSSVFILSVIRIWLVALSISRKNIYIFGDNGQYRRKTWKINEICIIYVNLASVCARRLVARWLFAFSAKMINSAYNMICELSPDIIIHPDEAFSVETSPTPNSNLIFTM